LHSFCCIKSTQFESNKLMNAVNKIVLLPLMLLIFTGTIANQDVVQIPNEIILSLKSGNAKVLASYFNQNIELVILDDDNVYSKAQAEQIVAGFFNRCQPEKFIIIHQGGKEDAQYMIGNLITKQGTFRVYFLLKKTAEKYIIHQLRIDKQQ
jgi:hypothetical protein